MVLDGHVFRMVYGTVMHHRFIPKANKFLYSMFYFHVPATALEKKLGNFLFGVNKPALFSVYDSDHGNKDIPSKKWIDLILNDADLNNIDRQNISLITLPRVMGYVFNPVSFWICQDRDKNLRAVICEVNNTFGEKHTYVCFKDDRGVINKQDEICAKKVFHVSPFIKREGDYTFRFLYNNNKFSSFIDYYNEDSQKMLATSVVGNIAHMSNSRLIKAFFLYPIITIKVIFLIHWQAAMIFFKGISYIPKPIQNNNKISHSHSPKNKE